MTLFSNFHNSNLMSSTSSTVNTSNHNRLMMAAISSNGATSPTNDLVKSNHIKFNQSPSNSTPNHHSAADKQTFVFVEDKMSNQYKQTNPKRKKKSVHSSNPSGITIFHHHHYQAADKSSTNGASSSSIIKSENPFIHHPTNNKVKIEKRKSKAKNGVQCVVVKEEIASLHANDDTKYEIGLEDGFTWWSWY